MCAKSASAAGYNEAYDELADEYGPNPGLSFAATSRNGNYTYSVELTRQYDQLTFHKYLDNASYNPDFSDDIVLDGWVDAGTKIWTASGWYEGTHCAAIEDVINDNGLGIAKEVSNQDQSYSFTLDCNYDKDDYTVVLTCWHYQVWISIALNGDTQSSHVFNYVPYVGGDFIYLDCPDT